MNDPIKIIHKYKNNNGNIQYHINIFIGDIVEKKCKVVLEKIKDMNLYDALTAITKSDTEILIKTYGVYWYEKFFNINHINYIKETTYKNNIKMKELNERYGKEWIDLHFIKYKKHLETVTYSYESLIKQNKDRRNLENATKKKIIEDLEDLDDYRLIKKVEDNPEYINKFELIGGNDEDIDEEKGELDLLFSEIDNIDDNAIITTNDIKSILSNSAYNKIYKQILDFDTSKDKNMFDENIRDVFQKTYIEHQYIYKDDNIKTIRNKICCGFKNNDKFGQDTYIIPSYQYLWSEYYLDDIKHQIMIGQKWIIKNNVLQIDTEPNTNLSIYKDLRGILKKLRDDIKRQGKIKREEDEYNILHEYDGYYTLNEIYMTDIYNDIGLNHNLSFEEIKNIQDIYIRIYYSRIPREDFDNIILFLKKETVETKKNIERNKLKKIYGTINNDLILENEIMKDVTLTDKNDHKLFSKYFKDSTIMHSKYRTYISPNYAKLDLYRIFDNFELSDKYPFIYFQPINGPPLVRYNKNFLMTYGKKEHVVKWLETSSYGIKFKVKINYDDEKSEEYVSLELTNNGRIDYNIQWKEEYNRNISHVKKSYDFIRDLVIKINEENSKKHLKLIVPKNEDFQFVFITTIQKFELPNNFIINHDDLSTFAMMFFPYIAVVVEPRKRESKITEHKSIVSKFGTYLRFKRISKYDSRTRIESRIIYFMRNYEYNDMALTKLISSDFNITEDEALKYIIATQSIYGHMKKSRKVLLKLENIPKYTKSPGITINIQGKTRDKYKIIISGAHDVDQLNRINKFMHVLIYLYVDTYLFKNRQIMKDRLMKLTNIARRRNKVGYIYQEIDQTITNIKQMVKMDTSRLQNKKNEGKLWSKTCQQSGIDNRRRPQQFFEQDDLLKKGYVWKESTEDIPFGHYVRVVKLNKQGKLVKNKEKGTDTIIRAVKLSMDEEGEKNIYYTCDPENNGKHINIGFLGKDDNAAPCCFIKDHMVSKNPTKKNLFLKNIGLVQEEKQPALLNEQLYILQDSVVVSKGRLSFLPTHLDILMNIMLNYDRKIINHRLVKTEGYFFKYGIETYTTPYLSALSVVFDIDIEQIKENMVSVLKSDKGKMIFISLNNGEIIDQFKTIDTYIDYIMNNEVLNYSLINDLITLPGVIRKNGIHIVFFQRKKTIIQSKIEKETIKIDYFISCQNDENILNIKDIQRNIVFLINEQTQFYPIVYVTKKIDSAKINVIKSFTYDTTPNNIINHLYDYYKLSCYSEYNVLINDNINEFNTAKNIYSVLMETNNKKFLPKLQYIDSHNKCKYLITNDGYIIPTNISGSLYNVKIITSKLDKYIKDNKTTIAYLNELDKITKSVLKMKNIGYYYLNKSKDNTKSYSVTYIITEGYNAVPIINESITETFINKHNYLIIHKTDYDHIDNEIIRGKDNYIVDKRIEEVSKNKYEIELYELFRLHLSYYLNNTTHGQQQKSKIIKIISSDNTKHDKSLKLKKILYCVSDKELSTIFNTLINKYPLLDGGSEIDKKWIHTQPETKIINYPSIIFSNNREICYDANNKNDCNNINNCYWNSKKDVCIFDIKQKLLIMFINDVVKEFIQNDIRAQEVLNINEYYVADIINRSVFKERPGEGIVVGSSKNTQKILEEYFGKTNINFMEKKNKIPDFVLEYDNINKLYPLKKIDQWYIQTIIENNNTLFRTFANAYFWLLHPYNNIDQRNLGYYSILQTELSNVYKSQVINWLHDKNNNDKFLPIKSYMENNTLSEFIIKLSMVIKNVTNNIIELYVLSQLYNIMIYVHDENNNYLYIFHPTNGLIFDHSKNKTFNTKITDIKKINIRFHYQMKKNYPDKIEVMYKI